MAGVAALAGGEVLAGDAVFAEAGAAVFADVAGSLRGTSSVVPGLK